MSVETANIVREELGQGVFSIKMTLTPDSYEADFKKELKKIAKQIDIKGFRKGMVPPALVRKLHGKSVLFDMLMERVNKELNTYLEENSIEMIAQPLPMETGDQINLDPKNLQEQVFAFKIAERPVFDIPLADGKGSVTRYNIAVEGEMVDEELASMRKQMGEVSKPEEISIDDSGEFLFEQLTRNTVVEDGVSHATWLPANAFKEGEDRDAILALKVGESAVVKDIFKAIDREEESILKFVLDYQAPEVAEGEKAPKPPKRFKVTLNEVNRVTPAELNEEFFKKVLGEETEVKDEAGLREQLEMDLGDVLSGHSDARLKYDMEMALINGTKIDLPEDFLKEYIQSQQEAKSLEGEEFEKEFEGFLKGFRWTMIQRNLMERFEIENTKAELVNFAAGRLAQQFAQYGGGMNNPEFLKGFAEKQLEEDEQYRNRTFDELVSFKIFEKMKEDVSIKQKDISFEDFKKLEVK